MERQFFLLFGKKECDILHLVCYDMVRTKSAREIDMKRNNALTTIMFTVVIMLLIAIVALGVVTVIKSNKSKPVTVNTTPTPTPTQAAAADVPGNTATPTQVPTSTPSPEPTSTPTPKALVCLDPGHQMNLDHNAEPMGPGALTDVHKMSSPGSVNESLNLKEYEWNLTVALMVRDELEARGYAVILTRTENDVKISNKERAEFANNNNADILVGIQADSYSSESVSGVYAQIAEADNPYAGVRAAENTRLATAIRDAVVKATGARSRSLQNGDNKLALLNWANMPACIMQLGYMSNPDEAVLLASEEYQRKLAAAVCDGIDAYFAK